MKTKMTMTMLVAFLMLAGTTLMGGCIPDGITGDGDVVKEDRKVSGFTSLEVSGAFSVYLTQGNSESLTVEADANLMQYIKTEVSGDRLEIYVEGKNIKKFKEMNIYLTFEELEMIDISGAVELQSENPLKFNDLTLEGSGASELKLEMKVDMLDADFSGASEITLMGEAKAANFDFSGASELDAFDFVIEACELDVSGAAEVRVHVTGSLEVDVSGAASVEYKGDPSIRSDVSGAGSVKAY